MNNLPNYQSIYYFIEIANTLNFSRASERLGISQPSLSHAIKSLEEKLGVELFIRIKKGVALTHGGKNFLIYAKQLIKCWDTAKSASLMSHQEVIGQVNLGCHPSVGLHVLPNILPNVMLEHPKLEVIISHDHSRKILEKVINLSLDIGIVVNPVKHPDLIMHKLYDDQMTFWQAKNKKITSDILICDPEIIQFEFLIQRFKKLNMKYPRIIASSNFELVANLTAQGLGIGILPETIANRYDLLQVKNTPTYHDEIYLVYRHENRNNKAVAEVNKSIKKIRE